MSQHTQNHGEWVAIENERRTNAYHNNALEALYGSPRKVAKDMQRPVSEVVRVRRPKRVRATQSKVAAVGSVSRY